MSHTSGPWRVVKDTYGVERIFGPDDESIACAEGDGFIPEYERVANRDLIVAAPALLAACKKADELINVFLRTISPRDLNSNLVDDINDTQSALSNAIAELK